MLITYNTIFNAGKVFEGIKKVLDATAEKQISKKELPAYEAAPCLLYCT